MENQGRHAAYTYTACSAPRRGRCPPSSHSLAFLPVTTASCFTAVAREAFSRQSCQRNRLPYAKTRPSRQRSSRRHAPACSGCSSVPSASFVEAVTLGWVRDIVVGLGLCPFAEPVLSAGTLRLAVSSACDERAVMEAVSSEVDLLIQSCPEHIATTLLVLPRFAADDFLTFHNVCADIEGGIDSDDALADQVTPVFFHPGHRWAHAESADDPINFDKRAPFPVVNLLRTPQLEEYIAAGKTERILRRNEETLERVGSQRLVAMYRLLGAHGMERPG